MARSSKFVVGRDIQDTTESARQFCRTYVPLGAQPWLVEALAGLLDAHRDMAANAQRREGSGS
jgi:hypothetical protein